MKTNKKILSTTLIAGIAICSLAPKVSVAATEMPDKFQSISADFGTTGLALSDTILTVNYGTSDNEVLFDAIMNDGDGAGPEAFWVESESSVYILDSLGQKINHYVDGNFADSTLLPSVLAPQCFTITSDGTIYVCDTYNGQSRLFIYDDGEMNITPILDLGEIRNITVTEDGLIQFSDWYDKYEYRLSDNTLVPFTKTKLVTSEMPANAYARQIGLDSNFRYELQTKLVNSCALFGEIRIVAVNSNDIAVSSARIPLEDFIYLPNQYFQINGEGEAYIMVPTADNLEIRKIILGAISDSKLDEVTALAAEYEIEAQAASTYSTTANVSLTREEVLNRANLMTMYSWTLSLANTSTKTNVTLPDFVSNALSSGKLENGGTVKFSGIPYCWGGFDSQYTSNNSGYSTFDQAIAAGYTAGNVCSTSSTKVSKTAGLDCSGFVSAAYGLSSKKGTSGLASFGTPVTKDTIQTMDFLVRYNNSNGSNHALLFYQWQSDDKSRMLIIEANNPSNYDDKVMVRMVNTDDYLNKGYVMRTPW